MVGEGSRGATLEITLAKILYTSSKSWLQLMLLKYCSGSISREKSYSLLSGFVVFWLLLENVV